MRERRLERARDEMRLVFDARGMALAGSLNPDGPSVERPRKSRAAAEPVAT